jgi:hypothetical protein
MAIPIPSNLPINPVVDFHRNDLITPPSAPTVVESLTAIDPRVALNMALPVGDSKAGGSLQDAIQNPANKNAPGQLLPTEPSVDQAVLLEISSLQENQAQISTNSEQANSLLAQNLTSMDSTGSAALGQFLSDILAVEVPELGQAVQTGKASQEQNVVVNWPNPTNLASNAEIAATGDPRQAMATLYQNLQSSGIFAADQLKKLLNPVSEDQKFNLSVTGDLQTKASHLLTQLSNNNSVQDSVKLLLRGDLLWQGQILPNVQGRLYREDAWKTDPRDPTQMLKGSKITMEVSLPNLGHFKVVGTQFGESVHVTIEPSSDACEVFTQSFRLLLDQMHSQVDPKAKVSFRDMVRSNGS